MTGNSSHATQNALKDRLKEYVRRYEATQDFGTVNASLSADDMYAAAKAFLVSSTETGTSRGEQHPYQEALNPTADLADYWKDGARKCADKAEALLYMENSANVWKNAAYAWAERAFKAESLPSSTRGSEDLVTVREDVVRFLLGEGPLEGKWYGDCDPGQPAYWWRNPLRISMHQYSLPSAIGGNDAKDAERYRWLRTYWRRVVSHAQGERIAWMSLHSDNTIATNEESVDAAIDRAIKESSYAVR